MPIHSIFSSEDKDPAKGGLSIKQLERTNVGECFLFLFFSPYFFPILTFFLILLFLFSRYSGVLYICSEYTP